MAKASPRTVTRDEPVARAAPRETAAAQRAPERDPNAIVNRDGRVIDLKRIANQSDDRFDLAALGIYPPKGWTYEWRTRMVKGAVWTDAIAEDEERGWTPVPADRHDGKLMPRGFVGAIERGGMMLMERDERLTAMSLAYQKRQANEQLNISRSMTGLAAKHAPNIGDIADFASPDAQAANFVRTQRIPMGSPDKNYTYQLDE